MNDLPSETHDILDNEIALILSGLTVKSFGSSILNLVLNTASCAEAYSNIWPTDKTKIDFVACRNLLASRPEIQSLLRDAYAKGKYAKIRNLPVFHVRPKQSISARHFITEERRTSNEKLLHQAYTQPFRGQSATHFLDYLLETDASMRGGQVIYAKSVSIVQSSGTGKSRMLTEIGKHIFTLPICLRGRDPGYPPGDLAAYDYFCKLHYNDNDLSISATIARFLGAAHTTMLKWLLAAQANRNAEELLIYWHTLMEGLAVRAERENFFREVVNLANSLPSLMMKQTHEYSDEYYRFYAKTATEELAAFTSSITPGRPIVLTYFDEADSLGESLLYMLRLLSKQAVTTSMWYVFMDTKSTISYFDPAPVNSECRDLTSSTICDVGRSKRLYKEHVRLLPPYVAVGFDQVVISEVRDGVTVKMGDLQSIKHLAKYGRPMWHAQYQEGEDDEQIRLAADKLICEDFMKFDPTDEHQVLVVLSQRVCIDTVVFSSEALKLAERSVASHMRFLTGFAPDQQTFYTYSPSEPMLTLGAALLLYNDKNDVLGRVLDTFSKKLCETGLVEKGLLGELAGRTLLTVARDLAAPKKSNGYSPNLLTPVLIMDFLDKFFGDGLWYGPYRDNFRSAFEDTYVNFTHWVVTRDPLPDRPSKKLLANLWARGIALQCYCNQESLDFQIVTYNGSIAPDAPFDIENLSVAIFQIKNKSDADKKALRSLRPIGLPGDLHRSLPYLAVVMELGNETKYRREKGTILVTPSKEASDGAFKGLWDAWESAVKQLNEYEEKNGKKKKDHERKKLLEHFKTAQAEMDAYNRYSINVRGASPTTYGCLKEANIVTQFATLIRVTMPSPTTREAVLNHMRPLERLGEGSAHTAWMTDYRGEGATDSSSDGNGDDSSGGNGDGSMDFGAMDEV